MWVLYNWESPRLWGTKNKLQILAIERDSHGLWQSFLERKKGTFQRERERERVEKEAAVVGKLLLISNYRAQLVHWESWSSFGVLILQVHVFPV